MSGLNENFRADFVETDTFEASFTENDGLFADFGEVQRISTGDYNNLTHKPSINEVELIGNKTFEDLGDKPLSNFEIKAIYDRVFGN